MAESKRERVILLIEDCAEGVPALEIALETEFGCAVSHQATGLAALEQFHRTPPHVAAIITDLHLPDLHGFDVIRQIRLAENGRRIPIVAVSADPDPRARPEALAAGADAFFSKPFSPRELCRRLQGILDAQNKLDHSSSDCG